MQVWDLAVLPVEPHHPRVLHSAPEGRAVAIDLPAGERLQEHQVHERTWMIVASGRVAITDHDGQVLEAGAGAVAHFDPNERREIAAMEDARLMLVLAPWPGVGHPSEGRERRFEAEHA
jgi:quercetin dioxygenase-like cupin family protein